MLKKIFYKLSALYNVYLGDGKVIKHDGYSVMIELTAICNLSCKFCPVSKDNYTLKRDVKFIKKEDAFKIIELTRPICRTYNIGMWGEPMLDKNIFEYLDLLKDKTVYMSTNLNYGSELAEKLSNYGNLNIVASVDGWDEESYQEIYRVGGVFDKVVENLSILSKGKCKVLPQFLMNSYTRTKLDEIFKFVDSFGIPRENILLNNMNENFRNEYLGTTNGVCHSFHQGFYFHCDGYLVPCCVNIDKDLNIVHISEISSTEELLNGEKVIKMRRALAKDKNIFESCKGCTQNSVFGKSILKSFLSNFKKFKTLVNQQ